MVGPARFPSIRSNWAWTLFALLGGLFVVLLVAMPRVPEVAVLLLGGAWVSLMLAMTLPSRAQRAGEELSSRRARFRHAVSAIGDAPTRVQLEEVLDLARTLDLRQEEIADDVERVRASMAALLLRDEIANGRLPVVSTDSLLPWDDTCHFVAPVRLGRRRSDEYGQLLLTSGWLKFAGTMDLSIAWSQVADVQRAGSDLVVTTADRRRALRFTFNSVENAARCGVIAEHLQETAHVDSLVVEDRLPYSAIC